MQLQHRAAGARQAPRSSRSRALPPQPGAAPRGRPRAVVARSGDWKVFGPSAEYSDGDADYFRLTSQLSDQYEWFAPRPSDEEASPASAQQKQQLEEDGGRRRRPDFGLSPREIAALGLSGPQRDAPDPATLSSKHYMRGANPFNPADPGGLGFSATMARAGAAASAAGPGAGAWAATAAGRGYTGARAAYGDYQAYPEGRPIFMPEAERFGNPPDLPSLLLQQRVIYISMPFVPSVTELVVAQCYYLDFDDKNRQRPIYVYLNSTGCINEQGKAISADNEFYAIWAALGFTRAPLYTGVTWKAQNQAAVLLAAGLKGHRYTFPHSKISTAPPVMNRVFGQAVDAQLQANELEYATKYYAAILARATGKDLATCQKEFLNRKRYFSVKQAYEEGLVDKLIPGYKLNRFRKIAKDTFGSGEAYFGNDKPKFRFERRADQA